MKPVRRCLRGGHLVTCFDFVAQGEQDLSKWWCENVRGETFGYWWVLVGQKAGGLVVTLCG